MLNQLLFDADRVLPLVHMFEDGFQFCQVAQILFRTTAILDSLPSTSC